MDVAAYQGEAGAFSEEGALALLPDAERRPLPSIRKVFEAVEVGRARWGLVPMDNSQAGSINETYDLFLRHAPKQRKLWRVLGADRLIKMAQARADHLARFNRKQVLKNDDWMDEALPF